MPILNSQFCAKFFHAFLWISICIVLGASPAFANPADGVVTGGSATILTTGSELQIHQQSSRALIEWKSFNIDAGETTRFIQPGANSIALNRVVNSQQVSMINGNLFANGHVLVINPNGVLIGPTGNIDAAGFIATTADVSDRVFMDSQGIMEFNRMGRQDAFVENQGSITVGDEGLALLVAPMARNSGVIKGNLARIQIGATDTFGVDFYGDGLIHLAVNVKDNETRKLLAGNTGSIVSDGGQILLTAAQASESVNASINMSGYIKAGSLINRGGKIVLTGKDAKVQVSGTIDASGTKGGGDVRIGGDPEGKGTLAKSAIVDIGDSAIIKADAIDQGNGGSIAVWSEDATISRGGYFARGGANGGNGGLIETSSGSYLDIRGTQVDTSAALGEFGDWLLDPLDLVIRLGVNDSANDGDPDYSGWINSGSNGFGDFVSEIYESELEGQDTNFILRAKRSVTVSGDSLDNTVQLMNNRSLTIDTENSDTFNGGIDLTGSVDGDALLFRTTGTGSITIRGSFGGSGIGNIKVSKLQTDAPDSIHLDTDNGTISVVSNVVPDPIPEPEINDDTSPPLPPEPVDVSFPEESSQVPELPILFADDVGGLENIEPAAGEEEGDADCVNSPFQNSPCETGKSHL